MATAQEKIVICPECGQEMKEQHDALECEYCLTKREE